ncbi:MAG TPA: type IV toxin-antitoxin system AbiEi family antitoxin [Paludibacter sp.]
MSESIKHTSDFLRSIRANGRYAFTIEDLTNNIPKSIKNIRKDLDRLRIKGDIINIRRGFFTIIPDEFKNMGVIPVEFYIDELMSYLTKSYYVGLYSAAMFHGAAHQQPQEFDIVSEKPKPRKINNERFLINFTEKRNFPLFGIEKKKTDTGYFNISSKELTFLDLIYFEQAMGGLNRIISILEELSEGINLTKMKEVVKNDFPLSVFQRAGYIAENILDNTKLAAIFANKLDKLNTTTILLKSSGERTGERNRKWNIIINAKIESDL